MALICVVIDKNGRVLTDEDLSNKVIDIPEYYEFMLPIRKRLNEETFSTKNVR